MTLSQSIKAIRQSNATIRSNSANANEHCPWYRLYVYWLLYPRRYNQSINNQILLSFLFAIVIAFFAVGGSLSLGSSNLECFIGLQSLIALIGSITLFDATQYVAPWQIRKLPLYATLPWSNHRLLIDYLRGMVKRGLVFFLASILMSIGYCASNPSMRSLNQWTPCIVATAASIVFTLTISCLLSSIGNPTTRYRVWGALAWLRLAAIAIALGTLPILFFPMFHIEGWPIFLSLFRFLPPGWPFALLQSFLEEGSSYGVVILSIALIGTTVLLGQIAWQSLKVRMQVVEFFGNDNRSLYGILPASSRPNDSYIRELDDIELIAPESSSLGLEPVINDAFGEATNSVEFDNHAALSLHSYRDRFWEANRSLRSCFERLLTENERAVVAMVYHHHALPKLREILWGSTLISLVCLALTIACDAYITWLPMMKFSKTLGVLFCLIPICSIAARWASGLNLHVYRFMPIDASTMIVAIWKFTVVYWLIGIWTVCPFFVIAFLYFGWPVHYALEAFAIGSIIVPCIAMIAHLTNLFVGTKQIVKPLNFSLCIIVAVVFLALAAAIFASIIVVNNPVGRVASSLLFWPWTYGLYRWAIHRYNHRTLDVGSPWPGY